MCMCVQVFLCMKVYKCLHLDMCVREQESKYTCIYLCNVCLCMCYFVHILACSLCYVFLCGCLGVFSLSE